jgi:hypothetical protein
MNKTCRTKYLGSPSWHHSLEQKLSNKMSCSPFLASLIRTKSVEQNDLSQLGITRQVSDKMTWRHSLEQKESNKMTWRHSLEQKVSNKMTWRHSLEQNISSKMSCGPFLASISA